MSDRRSASKKDKEGSKRKTTPPSPRNKLEERPDEDSSSGDERNDNEKKKTAKHSESNEDEAIMTEDEDKDKRSNRTIRERASNRTSNSVNVKESRSATSTSKQPLNYLIFLIVPVIAVYLWVQNGSSSSPTNDIDWRLQVDPMNVLSDRQQSTVRASLKPILDKSSRREEGVSTLLILSSDEENAAKLGRCLLGLVNAKTHENKISTEVDLQSHSGGKLKLDSNLKTLLNPGGDIRAVLLRHIDVKPSKDSFDQLRLLFGYCDGENPVIPHRLIIMTATSHSTDENELRERFKSHWLKEHDFVDALMSRISGHTLYVDKNQKSIC